MKYTVNKENRPVYLQIYKHLRNDIINESFRYNSKLPSKRLLAEETGVSTVTVEHAYALLCDEGYAEARERSGYFVIFRKADGFAASEAKTEPSSRPAARIKTDYPAFSVSILSKTMRRVLTDYRDVILDKPPNTGCDVLRSAIKRYLVRNRGIDIKESQIVIGSGAEYLYRLLIELLGRDKTYAVESPSYDKIEQIYAASGVSYERLPLSTDGIDSDALSHSNADILQTTPYRSFPSGVTASATKRHEYIRWASKADRIIIESDYGSEFSVASQPTETLFALSNKENIIYMNTFSRTISPSIRIGYAVLPEKLAVLFNKKLGFYSCTVPTFEQYVLAELINNGDFERHINRVRRSKRKELNGK